MGMIEDNIYRRWQWGCKVSFILKSFNFFFFDFAKSSLKLEFVFFYISSFNRFIFFKKVESLKKQRNTRKWVSILSKSDSNWFQKLRMKNKIGIENITWSKFQNFDSRLTILSVDFHSWFNLSFKIFQWSVIVKYSEFFNLSIKSWMHLIMHE